MTYSVQFPFAWSCNIAQNATDSKDERTRKQLFWVQKSSHTLHLIRANCLEEQNVLTTNSNINEFGGISGQRKFKI